LVYTVTLSGFTYAFWAVSLYFISILVKHPDVGRKSDRNM